MAEATEIFRITIGARLAINGRMLVADEKNQYWHIAADRPFVFQVHERFVVPLRSGAVFAGNEAHVDIGLVNQIERIAYDIVRTGRTMFIHEWKVSALEARLLDGMAMVG